MGAEVTEGSLGVLAQDGETLMVQGVIFTPAEGYSRPASRAGGPRPVPFNSTPVLLGVVGGFLALIWYWVSIGSNLISSLSVCCLVIVTIVYVLFLHAVTENVPMQ